jgi:gentisate 1,2-dioxygenase
MMDLMAARSGAPSVWPPLRVPADAIEKEIQRLADAPRPANGQRASTIVHPDSREPGLGFAPGVDVTIQVLKPGESTTLTRRNSNQIEFCIAGTGTVRSGSARIRMGKWDVCSIPSMQPHTHRNDGDLLWVRLVYSNAPLLEKLGIHYVDKAGADDNGVGGARSASSDAARRYTRLNAPDIPIGSLGARMRGYEFLTDIEVVPSVALHWPWQEIENNVSRRAGDGKRGIMLLYNPATERRNGTTHSFFATISSTPAGAPPRATGRGHRHSSVAINYHFEGAGRSTVDGHVIEWRAGDLLLSAPAWSEHSHFIYPEGGSVLTVQDHPLHIGMESLIWQERMDGPILTLGSEAGQTGYVGPRTAGP